MSARRCGVVAVLGPPNAGKSTLINALVGRNVVLVTRRSGTTRERAGAAFVRDETQIVLVDTPGISDSLRRADADMRKEARRGLRGVDEALFVVDSRPRYEADADAALDVLSLARIPPSLPVSLVLNKIDEASQARLLARIRDANRRFAFRDTFPVSALKNRGIDTLTKVLGERMPEREWFRPDGSATDMPDRLFAAEMTRGRLLTRLNHEVPYVMRVEPSSWTTLKDGSLRIGQTIIVGREEHKAILLGAGGSTIGFVGAGARRDMERTFGRRVHLFLFVKVRSPSERRAEGGRPAPPVR